MNEITRHRIIYQIAYHLIKWPVKCLFGYTCGDDKLTEPTLVVSNHVTDIDFFFVAIGLNGSHTYYVASEHIFRLGWISRFLTWLVSPIARRKGTTAMDTAMTMVRRLRAGQSVCVFGEGETTWNGRTVPIYPATATLARVSGKPLKTFRIEGGHLSMPRWGNGLRRGRMHGHVINTYSPEQLKAMTADEINEAINRDIYEDAWIRQKQHPVRYHGRNRAESIETVLFLCPECKRIGTVYGKRNHVLCGCGFKAEMTDYGSFDPPVPFENIAQWDQWQMDCLKKGDYAMESGIMDLQLTLYRFAENGSKEEIANGKLILDHDTLRIGGYDFAFSKISSPALIQKRVLVFTCEDVYYELRASRPLCLRKYLAAWQNHREQYSERG